MRTLILSTALSLITLAAPVAALAEGGWQKNAEAALNTSAVLEGVQRGLKKDFYMQTCSAPKDSTLKRAGAFSSKRSPSSSRAEPAGAPSVL